MSIEATYIIDGIGLNRVGREIKGYEQETFEAGLAVGLKDHDRVTVLLEEENQYKWDQPYGVFFVKQCPAARENFIRVCRILGTTPKNFVYAVQTCEGLVSVHKTYDGAMEALDVVKYECDARITLAELED